MQASAYLDVANKVVVVVFSRNTVAPTQINLDGDHLKSWVDGSQPIDNLSVKMKVTLPLLWLQSIFVYYIIYSQVVLIPMQAKKDGKKIVKIFPLYNDCLALANKMITCTSNPCAQADSTSF